MNVIRVIARAQSPLRPCVTFAGCRSVCGAGPGPLDSWTMHRLLHHWYRDSWFSVLLLPLSWIYCGLVWVRRQLYRRHVLASVRPPVPVIVVGNITVGGTGKTPLVIWLARFLGHRGFRPGIVTRGYGGHARSWPLAVEPDSDPEEGGDEPVLLARACACPVVADPQRPRAARYLIDRYGCDVIVSDDGLQHYALQRDLEIAVIDGDRRFGNGRCLPAGPLREPLGRIDEVDACITNGAALGREWGMRIIPRGFFRLGRARPTPTGANEFHGTPVHAVAGIGNPARFFAQLRGMGLQVTEHPFPDHHCYTRRELDFGDDRPVIMTEKDAVKCERLGIAKCWYLAIEAEPDPRLGELVIQALRRRSGAREEN